MFRLGNCVDVSGSRAMGEAKKEGCDGVGKKLRLEKELSRLQSRLTLTICIRSAAFLVGASSFRFLKSETVTCEPSAPYNCLLASSISASRTVFRVPMQRIVSSTASAGRLPNLQKSTTSKSEIYLAAWEPSIIDAMHREPSSANLILKPGAKAIRK